LLPFLKVLQQSVAVEMALASTMMASTMMANIVKANTTTINLWS
jgi:hypothetical protein